MTLPTGFERVTRVTVVGPGGTREFEKFDLYPDVVQLELQDDGRTLKIFPREFDETENLRRMKAELDPELAAALDRGIAQIANGQTTRVERRSR